MKNTCFTVASSKAEKISAILIFLLVCVPFSIAGLVILDKLIMRIICICLFALGVFVVLSSFLICLSIEDNILKGRTMTARRFEFDLSEIKNTKHLYFLLIFAVIISILKVDMHPFKLCKYINSFI